MKTVFVIGSNSFSGSDFIDLLLETDRYNVVGLSRSPEKTGLFLPYKKRLDSSNFEFHQIDLNHDMLKLFSLLVDREPAYIVNFAAQSEVAPSWENPDQWFQTNTVSIAKLSNFLKDQKWLEKYVHISSPEVYGTCDGNITEVAPINPTTPYAASKAAGDLMLLTLVKSFSFPLVIIRSTNVYGSCQQLFKIIPRSIIYLKSGRKIELHGAGEAIKSYIHIRDVSLGQLVAMERGKIGEIYHFSPDQGIRVRDLVKKICQVIGKDFRSNTIDVGERLGQDKAYVIDSTKARNQFLWLPEITLTDGLQQVRNWVEEEWDLICSEPLEYVHRP
ncbi:dTDP-glucose 4,6-dehydratase [Candidatus Poribacteria bacterium]|nr:dTDP-glucose 4,6-dehydratase [Candidatus Poribacteria bacterium]